MIDGNQQNATSGVLSDSASLRTKLVDIVDIELPAAAK